MSLINDALKQARKSPPEGVPSALAPLQPVAGGSSAPAWLLPTVVVVLVVVATFSIGWAAMRHVSASQSATVATSQPVAASRESATVVATPQSVAVTPQIPPPVTTAPLPAAQPQPANPSPPPPIQPTTPKLQGIDYSPTAPSAIVDGKTIRPGDRFHQYRVKAISRDAVTLIGPDQKELVLDLEN